eukprot:1162016-Pelagomonas_calceolata.AAC.11
MDARTRTHTHIPASASFYTCNTGAGGECHHQEAPAHQITGAAKAGKAGNPGGIFTFCVVLCFLRDLLQVHLSIVLGASTAWLSLNGST